MAGIRPALFGPRRAIANGATVFVPVPVYKGVLGCQICWHDAGSTFTVTLELTDWGEPDALVDVAGTADIWKDSGVTITQTPGAANSVHVQLMNVRAERARLRIVAGADSVVSVLPGAINA